MLRLRALYTDLGTNLCHPGSASGSALDTHTRRLGIIVSCATVVACLLAGCLQIEGTPSERRDEITIVQAGEGLPGMMRGHFLHMQIHIRLRQQPNPCGEFREWIEDAVFYNPLPHF